MGNLETVQHIYQAFATGDIQTILKLMTDDTDWRFYAAADIPWARSWRGRHGVEQFFKALSEGEAEVFQADEFFVDRDTIVVLGHERVRGRATGRVVEAPWAQVWTLQNGLVSQFREYSDVTPWWG